MLENNSNAESTRFQASYLLTKRMNVMRYICYFLFFLATKTSASCSRLDVSGAAVPACVQSFRHRGLCRSGTSFVYAEVTHHWKIIANYLRRSRRERIACEIS